MYSVNSFQAIAILLKPDQLIIVLLNNTKLRKIIQIVIAINGTIKFV